ncbi:hypothetical protein NFI96_024271 [Prochilodus magdalenae]|nr:hypothetical protein NFI96_024271 [Prochilodus magdalenae]
MICIYIYIYIERESLIQCILVFPVAFLSGVVLLTIIQVVSTTVPCIGSKRNIRQNGVRFARLINKNAAEIIKTYQANQGDFAEQFCKMSMDNIPASTLSGQTQFDRVLSIYTRLKEFLPHVRKVLEQQSDMQPPSSQLLKDLFQIREQISLFARNVNCIFQTLQPNFLVPEPPAWPTRIPPAQNVFQQKVYGCVVLTRLSEFLSTALNELKSLKSKRPRSRSRNY